MIKTKRWVIILIIVAVIAITAVGCILFFKGKDNINNDVLQNENNNKQNEIIGNEKEEFKYNEEDITDLVYEKDLFRAEAVTGLSGSNPVNIDATVVQPYINIKSDDVDKINARLKELYDERSKKISHT